MADDGRVTASVVRRVAPGRPARASVEVWGLTVFAHSLAGGALPSLPWLVGVAGIVAAATAWVLRRQANPAVMAPVLVACQLGLHVLFASLAPAGHGTHHAHGVVDLPPRMLAAHMLCAVLTAVVWWVRRSVVDVVLRLAAPLTLAERQVRIPDLAQAGIRQRMVWLLTDPGRAPPRASALV
jgi:hypothetical protein